MGACLRKAGCKADARTCDNESRATICCCICARVSRVLLHRRWYGQCVPAVPTLPARMPACLPTPCTDRAPPSYDLSDSRDAANQELRTKN